MCSVVSTLNRIDKFLSALIKDVEYEHVEINNNSIIFFKMAAKMAAENSNLMYISSVSDAMTNEVSIHMKQRTWSSNI